MPGAQVDHIQSKQPQLETATRLACGPHETSAKKAWGNTSPPTMTCWVPDLGDQGFDP